MIYRFVVCSLLASFGVTLLLATALTNQVARLGPRRAGASTFWPSLITSILRGRVLWILLLLSFAVALFFLWPGIVEFQQTGGITLHWSRLLAGSLSLFCFLETAVFALLIKVVSIWQEQSRYNNL